MSTIAVTMPMLAVLAAVVPAEPALRRMTARGMLAASRAATTIGPDPCRAGGGEPGGEEIVVCGQRESPYALPGYDPLDRYSAQSQAGGSRTAMTSELKAATSACATGSAFCMPPPTVNLFQALPVIVKGIQRLLEGDD